MSTDEFPAVNLLAGPCETCNGHGVVGRMTFEGGDYDDCPDCKGTGNTITKELPMTDPTPTPPELDLAALHAKAETMANVGILDWESKITGHQLVALLEYAEANRKGWGELLNDFARMEARAEDAEAKIAAVRELHAASPCEPDCCLLETCNECLNTYPCPTIAALDTHTPETETP